MESEQIAAGKPMLGEMLVAASKLSERDLERALVAQREMGGLLGEVLVRLGLVAEMDVVNAFVSSWIWLLCRKKPIRKKP